MRNSWASSSLISSSEAGAVAGADAGTQVAAYGGGTDKHDAGLLLVDDLGDGLGVRLGHIVLEQVVVDHQHFVSAMFDKSLGQRLDVFAEEHGNNFFVVGVGQLAGFAEKLKSHILQFAFALLGKHINVFIFC